MYRELLLGLSLTTLSFVSYAESIKVTGTVTASAVVTQPQSNKLNAKPEIKEVYLMKVDLNDEQRNVIENYQAIKSFAPSQGDVDASLPTSAFVGMNDVPVLDQGRHGTCVTFANTAAVDALLGRGDYVSQLCNLTLGSYIADRGYTVSGWDGSWGPYVLNQLMNYGFVSKQNQKLKTCGGLDEYPLNNENEIGKQMSLDDFKLMSESIADLDRNHTFFYWKPVLDFSMRFGIDNTESYNGENVLMQVKQILARKIKSGEARITFGTLLPYQFGSAGACAKFHAENDTWALTKDIVRHRRTALAGHEMIIIGYDDNAYAVDGDGVKHKGLLTLRNSWSNKVGDNGNYYMSYEFFKKYVMEVQKVALIKNVN